MLLNNKTYSAFIILFFAILLAGNWSSTKMIGNVQANNIATSKPINNDKPPLDWVKFSPVLEKVSAPVYQYITGTHLEKTINKSDKKPSKTIQNQTLAGNLPNIIINDTNLEDSLKIQSQTASAAFGDNIVVVYNKTGVFPTSA
ncbi:MAG: hypothetical protein FD167_6151, partial [bacterium]